jgi:NADPH-dependent glutamate synthase beta subunit-like oxidoreductase
MEGRTHRPEHDEARCAACAICFDRCPSVPFPEYRLDPTLVRGAVHRCGAGLPVADDVPPCRAACPLHQDTRGYAAALAAGDPTGALALIHESNPLPAVCGTVCNRSCERACLRARTDRPVAIRALKRAAAELGRTARSERSLGPGYGRCSGPLDVAVVGAGPAGLAAAHDLAAAGFGVSLYDDQPNPGGLAANAIPSFVLPRPLLEADVEFIRELGVEIRSGVRVGRDVPLASMRKAYRAVLLAVGAWKGKPLGLPGETGLRDVIDHVAFARAAAVDGPAPRSGPAVVLGGSQAALHCARIAVRLGCDPVVVAFPRPLDRFAADADAIEDAVEEGVRLAGGLRAAGFDVRDGAVAGVRFARVVESDPDAWGHRRLEPTGEETVLPASLVVVAHDREPDLALLAELPGVRRTPLGFIDLDPKTGMTHAFGVFAAGDVVTGPKTVVEAIASGRRAAARIRRFLAGEG